MENPEKEMQQPPWTDQAPPRVVEAKTSIISASGADALGSDNTCSVTEARGKAHASPCLLQGGSHHISRSKVVLTLTTT